MSGFLGFGNSGGESASTSNLNNIFNYGLPTAQQSQASGTNTLNQAEGTLAPATAYYQNLLTAGRQQTAQNASPAINATLAGADAQKRQEATSGTGRTGGTAELNREQGATTNATIDNIINQTLQTGQQAGAAGLGQVANTQGSIGSTQLNNAIANLGIANTGQESLYTGAIGKEGSQGSDFASIISSFL